MGDANPTSKGRFIMSDGYDIKPLYFISSNADGGGDSGGGRGMGARISFATEVQEPPPDDFVSLRQEMLGHDKRSTVSSGGDQRLAFTYTYRNAWNWSPDISTANGNIYWACG